jgi:hypothetical protein
MRERERERERENYSAYRTGIPEIREKIFFRLYRSVAHGWKRIMFLSIMSSAI